MSQKNMRSGKSREIRAPYKWKQPEKPIVEPGPTFCIKVPPGSPGTCIHVPHPAKKGQFIAVNVPAKAKVGAAMLVPIPKDEDLPTPVPDAPTPSGPTPAAPTPAAPATEEEKKKGGWSTGAKVAAGTAGVVAVGGLAVAGAVLGEHIAEEGWDATMAELGDVAADAGEAISGEDCWISYFFEDPVWRKYTFIILEAFRYTRLMMCAMSCTLQHDNMRSKNCDGKQISPSLGFCFGIVLLVSLNFKLAGAAEDVGEAVAGAAEDAGEWIAGAAEDAGDFIMDLFWAFVGYDRVPRKLARVGWLIGPSSYQANVLLRDPCTLQLVQHAVTTFCNGSASKA